MHLFPNALKYLAMKLDQTMPLESESVRWDTTSFYSGINDPKIELDLKAFEAQAQAFATNFRNQLGTKLGTALDAYTEIILIAERLNAFFYLTTTVDLSNDQAKTLANSAERRLSQASGEYLQFFDLELNALDDATVNKLIKEDPRCAKHEPLIRQTRRFKAHQLSEPVESALAKRAPFSAGAWGEYHDEVEADLRVMFESGEKSLTEMINIMSSDPSSNRRAEAMAAVDTALSGPFVKFASRALSVEAGLKAVEDRERHYPNALSARNLDNQIPDEVVEALHSAVIKYGAPLVKRYYLLKAKLLGLKTLAWSDRNAPLPYAETATIPYPTALKIVLDGYRGFSPTLASRVEEIVAKNWIDAPTGKSKRSGAFNYSIASDRNHFSTFVMLNYLGKSRDVETLAHELGHAVHGLLAGEAQGPLMFRAPTAYAETASVFGEEITFRALRDRLGNDKPARLALICARIDESLNTVVRQIGFSNFEKKIHTANKQLAESDLNQMWLESLYELYGQPGEVFTYEHTERLWSYVSHFHRPFYCYGYAFGQLLTQSLYAAKDGLGENFEPLYLNLLRAGGTKNASDLLAPFNLDPKHPDFWKNGIEVGLGKMISEAESLAEEVTKK